MLGQAVAVVEQVLLA
jgi:hypothetical protein